MVSRILDTATTALSSRKRDCPGRGLSNGTVDGLIAKGFETFVKFKFIIERV